MKTKAKALILCSVVIVGCNEYSDPSVYNSGAGPAFQPRAYENYKDYHREKESFGPVPTTKDVETFVSEQTSPPVVCLPEVGGDVGTAAANLPPPNASELPKILPSGNKIWNTEWSQEIYKSLGEDHLTPLVNGQLPINQKDLDVLNCPNFNKLNPEEKKKFWVVFMAAVAKPESDYNPKTVYPDYDGTDSTGLLQIDKNRANEHCKKPDGVSRFTTEDMKDPKVNLRCGLQIMKHQLNGGMRGKMSSLKGRLFTADHGQPYYWSVLHGKKKQIVQTTFKAHAKTQLPFCAGEYSATRSPASQPLMPDRLREIADNGRIGEANPKCDPSINTDRRTAHVEKVETDGDAPIPRDGGQRAR